MAKENEKKKGKKKEEFKCPYCGKLFETHQALGGHKPHCPERDLHNKIKVIMLSSIIIGEKGNKQYLPGREYEVTRKFYKSHKFAMKPVRQRK